MTERISVNEIEIYRVLTSMRESWLTNAEIATRAGIARLRLVQATTRKFVQLDLLDQADIAPERRFRWAGRNAAYCLRLQQADAVLGRGDGSHD